MDQGPCTLALRASQSFSYRELIGRVTIVIVIRVQRTPQCGEGLGIRGRGKTQKRDQECFWPDLG